MLTINSSAIERSASWLKQPTPVSNTVTASRVSTVSLQNRPVEDDTVSLSTQAAEHIQAPEVKPRENPYASTIVNFMRQQLQRDLADGADKELLATRLEAGYQGFLQGFEEAYALLGGEAALPDEVKNALAETKIQVGQAVAKLARDFDIKSPDIQLTESTTPEDSEVKLARALDQLAQTANTDNLTALAPHTASHHAAAQSRSLNLHLTTVEGDIIELIANNKHSAVFDDSMSYSEQSQQWTLSVQGDLNENEQGAIADFLNQLGGLADEFYQGDLAQAVAKAQNIGFDNAQISEFSLNMQQVDIQRIENAYSGPQAGDSEIKNPVQAHWQLLGQWLTQLDKLYTDSLNNALPEYWIDQLSQQSLAQWYPDNEQQNDFLTDRMGE
ncbi:MAG: hypothetical protein RL497_2893 [Pseudomonadota bacterium]|jgi:hypothetical protein